MNRLFDVLGPRVFLIIFLVFLAGQSFVIGQTRQIATSSSSWESEYSLYQLADSAKRLLDQGDAIKVIDLCNNGCDSMIYKYDSKYLGYLNLYKGSAYLRMGNYFLSECCYDLALSYGQNYQLNDLISSAINNMAGLAIVSKDFLKAKELLIRLLNGYNGNKFNSLKISATINLAEIAIMEGDSVAARIYLSDLYQFHDEGVDYLFDRTLGRLTAFLGNRTAAIIILKRALLKGITLNGAYNHQKGLCYLRLAECYDSMNIRDSAEINYSLASQVLSGGLYLNAPVKGKELPQYETVLVECLIKQGEFYRKNSLTLSLAYDHFQKAIDRLLYLSHAITAESARFIIAEKGRHAFNNGIECALELFDQTKDVRFLEQAFEWSLQSKSLSLNWLVEKNFIYARVGIPVVLIDTLTEYRKKLELLSGKSFENAHDKPTEAFTRLISLYEETENQIRTKYSDIRRGMTLDPISNRIRKKDFSNERYLGYYDLDSLIVIFTISPAGWSFIRIPKDTDLIARISRFKEIISEPPLALYSSIDVHEYAELSYTLFDQLVKPALTGSPMTNLAIHPDGILLGLPFEALTNERVKSLTFKGLPFLLDQFHIRYLSASLMVGPNKVPAWESDSITILSCKDAVAMPDVKAEVDVIAGLFKNSVIYYLDQRKTNELDLGGQNHTIHISGHLTVNSENPLESVIHCAGDVTDGISFRDVLKYQLAGSQVYINTCESGNGAVNHGEGLMSLGLAFSMAGCTTIIQHSWKAPDHASGIMARGYYKHLGRLCPAEAITQSKRQYLRRAGPGLDHPYYWAGLVCYSNIGESNLFIRILVPIIIGLILCAWVVMLVQKRIGRKRPPRG